MSALADVTRASALLGRLRLLAADLGLGWEDLAPSLRELPPRALARALVTFTVEPPRLEVLTPAAPRPRLQPVPSRTVDEVGGSMARIAAQAERLGVAAAQRETLVALYPRLSLGRPTHAAVFAPTLRLAFGNLPWEAVLDAVRAAVPRAAAARALGALAGALGARRVAALELVLSPDADLTALVTVAPEGI